MIKLYDGQITDLLPEKIAEDTYTQCLSYALRQEHQRLLDLADKTRTASLIHSLPEKILDILAIELRAPYYEDTLELEVKRDIIANTLKWHTKSGTPAAVQELVSVVFGEGRVIEWWDFTEGDKTPGLFDIETSARQTQEELEQFASIIRRVKNTRSHIRAIRTHREIYESFYVAAAYTSTTNDVVKNQSDKRSGTRASPTVSAAVVATQNCIVANTSRHSGNMAAARKAACHIISLPRTKIPRA